MKTPIAFLLGLVLLGTSCSRKNTSTPALKPTGVGATIVESSGGKQLAQAGTLLPQPVVVQVNDEQGTAVPGALVEFSAVPGVSFDPSTALTDSSGQVTTNVSLAGIAGRYQITASTFDKSHKKVEIKFEEIALGYLQTLGRHLNDQYCERCHNAESTAERVSNYDNLEVKPHPFSEGDILNKMTDADDGHYYQRRTGFTEVCPHAGLGKYTQQVRDTGANCIHPRSF